MTSRAAAAAIISWIVVRSGKREQRVEQARFLQAEKHGIGPQQRAESAIAQLIVRAPGFLFAIGNADFTFLGAAAFKNAQDVSRLRYFPAFERREFRNDSFEPDFVRRRRWNCENRLRSACWGIAFTEMRVFQWVGAIVVERGSPQHGAVRHHAGFYFQDFRGMTSGAAASFCSDSQIARIYEPYVFVALAQPFRVEALRIRRSTGKRWVVGLRMRALLDLVVLGSA